MLYSVVSIAALMGLAIAQNSSPTLTLSTGTSSTMAPMSMITTTQTVNGQLTTATLEVMTETVNGILTTMTMSMGATMSSSSRASSTGAATTSSMSGMSMSGASNDKNPRLGAGAGIGGLVLAVAYVLI
ncbi:hypothetical protein FKW77_008598 [Venturia effusa]|uniref:REJ domain-containing protein n=1 Tax=Venturia effusa TaxID=50376 RepID=A0A517KZZ8_9PEZI|nr:hypothetical protein FKW77_008598 [Venturia effusa]